MLLREIKVKIVNRSIPAPMDFQPLPSVGGISCAPFSADSVVGGTTFVGLGCHRPRRGTVGFPGRSWLEEQRRICRQTGVPAPTQCGQGTRGRKPLQPVAPPLAKIRSGR